jgi:hypothetical protein
MDKRTFAAWSVFAGLMLGLVGLVFFYDKPLGLSAPLYALVVSAVVLATAHRAGLPLRWRTLWPILPLMFFASMIAIYANGTMTFVNLAAVFALGALVLHYLPRQQVIDEEGFGAYVGGATEATLHVPLEPFGQGWEAVRWLREQRSFRGPQAVAIARGLVFTLPLLFVFAILLGSADTVFNDYLERIARLFNIRLSDALIDQVMIAGGLAWLGCGALAYSVGRWLRQTPPAEPKPAPKAEPTASASVGGGAAALVLEAQPAFALAAAVADTEADVLPRTPFVKPALLDKPERKSRKRRPFILGMIEASIMLASVDLLFGVFVLIQFAYFFGGQANIVTEGFTYAQYARRGFFELVAVSVLTLGLVLWLDWVTVRHDRRQTLIFRILAVVLVALTGVMLLSASGRMTLYEQAYGLTHLRVYTHVFMFWLAVLFGVFLLALFRVRAQVFSVGLLLVIAGYAGTLNVLNVEALITGENVERYLANPAEDDLDICYLRTMSVDAVAPMVALYQAPQTSDENRQLSGEWLRDRLRELDRDREAGLFGFNVARANAWALLEPLRDTLPGYRTDSSEYYACSMYARVSGGYGD